jgi:hypothetical protein
LAASMVLLASAEGAPCYTHWPEFVQRSLLRQQLHPDGPQHALGRRESLLQHVSQLSPSPRFLQKSERSNLRLHLRLVIAISISCASTFREAKSPSVEATRAAPPSFIALPREIAPVSIPLARSSRDSSFHNEARIPPSSLLINTYSSFQLSPAARSHPG